MIKLIVMMSLAVKTLSEALNVHAVSSRLCEFARGKSEVVILAWDFSRVEQVDNFVYVGSIQSSVDGSQPDIKRRIVLASSVMSSLQPIWSDRYLSLPTKVRV